MPNYAYVVLNKNGEKLAGTIDANSVELARESLNKLGFSIVEIKETLADEKKDIKGMTVYEFEGKDETGKRVEGTIKSSDRLSAYKKLKKEYNLEINYIVDSGLDQQKKEEEKKKGTSDLEAKLTEGKIIKNEQNVLKLHANEEENLKAKAAFVIKKINEFVEEYQDVLDKEKLSELLKEKDKLLRIKSSKNLDLIKETAESLLKMLQQEELFIKEKISDDKKTHIKVEAKKIMDELSTKDTPPSNIKDKICAWNKENFEDREDLKFHQRIIKKILEIIINLLKEDPEVTKAKQKISAINTQIWEYVKLYAKEESKEDKKDIIKSIKLIWAERRKLKQELNALKTKLGTEKFNEEKEQTIKGKSTLDSVKENLVSFTGWLLCFYLAYYFASIYITTKDFGLTVIPQGFYIYSSITFKYIIVIIFLLHTALSIKKNIFPRNTVAAIVIYPLFVVAGVLIIFNL